MKNVLLISQLVISASLAVAILLQARGTGLGTTFGGLSEQYRSKRGIEKILYKLTLVLVALFLTISLINLFVK